MKEERQFTDEEIERMAKMFFEENFKKLFPPDITCEACGVENCCCNERCINCGCQL